MIRLLLNDILTFHEQLDKATGIRDLGLIESAVNAPFQTFGGKFLYPAVEERAASQMSFNEILACLRQHIT